jgi:hypothetical protein
MLSSFGQTTEAVREYEEAISLRPLDYVLWLSLGSARDEAGDTDGALVAFREAVRLAPFYAEPRWQLGNLLLRARRSEEAFAEMRAAALSQPTYLPNFIDLVWGASRGDAATVESVVRPETDSWRLTLARFFVKRGKVNEALALYRAAGSSSVEDRQSLLKELLAAKQFAEAHQVWKGGAEEKRSGETEFITDGSFESGAKVNEPGFGWQLITNSQLVRVSLDSSEPGHGSKSLLLDWRGNVDAATPALSQLVLVDAGSRYRLGFSFRTKDLTTGGPPIVVITDASAKDAELARSAPLPKTSGGWQEQTLEFTTGQTTRAVTIKMIRQSCASAPCPVFGQIWLDGFSLRKL